MNAHAPTREEVRTAFATLRPLILDLARRWRLRRAGTELRLRFAALEIAMSSDRAHDELARTATDELVALLARRASSPVVGPALAAARALAACWTGDTAGRFYSLTSFDGGETEVVEMTAEEAAEMAEVQKSMPPGRAW